jgi:putative ABC transport system substrate-binding protein
MVWERGRDNEAQRPRPQQTIGDRRTSGGLTMHLQQLARFASTVLLLICCVVLRPGLAQDNTGSQRVRHHGVPQYRIGLHLFKSATIYDEAIAGITDGLDLEGIAYETVLVNSHNDPVKARENLRTLDAMGLDLVYSLSSDGTLIAREIGMKTPIIATVINHPASLGVTQTPDAQHLRLTGTSYYIDTRKQLQFYRTLFPHITRVGMIYDKHNSAGYAAEEPFMRRSCQELGIEFLSVGIADKNDLTSAAETLLQGGVHILVLPTNNLVYLNIPSILKVTHAHQVPVVSMSKQGVESGALAGLFADTYELGRYTAPMAKQILIEKIAPQHIPFQFIHAPSIILNLKTAKELGYEFPSHILGQATTILQ